MTPINFLCHSEAVEREGREFWHPSTSQTKKETFPLERTNTHTRKRKSDKRTKRKEPNGKNVSILPEGKRNHLSPNVPLAPLAITSVQ